MSSRAAFLVFVAVGIAGCGSVGDAGTDSGSTDAGPSDARIVAGDAQGPPDSGAVIVRECSLLGEVGAWEQVSVPGVPIGGSDGSSIQNVLVNPRSPGELYVGTYQRGIFHSTDCGASWTKINTGENSEIIDSGTPWLFAIDPVTPNVLYADTFNGSSYRLYKSINGGVDWTDIWPLDNGHPPMLIDIDPTNHEHIIVTVHADCDAPTPLCFQESFDGGAHWTALGGPPGGWVEGAAPVIIDASTFLLGSAWTALYLTTNSGRDWQQVSDSGGVRMLEENGWYYVGRANGLQRSQDLVHWTSLDVGPGGETTYGVVSDGVSIYVASRSQVYSEGDGHLASYMRSAITDGETWTSMPTPGPLVNPNDGAFSLAVDREHHLLYSGNQSSGLFRMRTE